MARYLMIIEANCKEPDQEAEFNEWYDTVHIPDILAEPGTVRVSRWVDTEATEGRGKYFALIEIETEDISQTLEKQKEQIPRLEAANRLSALFVPVSRRILRKISQ